MAKDTKPAETTTTPEMVSVPAADLKALLDRVAKLEQAAAVSAEAQDRQAKVILDEKFEAWKREVSRPAAERTQDMVNRKYGTDAPRFTVRLDSTTEDGKPGPKVSEHPVLEISGNAALDPDSNKRLAEARYLEFTGIKKHDYRIVTTPVAA